MILAFLSPTIAELLSGSSPPLEFFNPIALFFLVGLYGSGVIVVRELSIKWRTGWEGVLVLGAAYGIIEEGLAVKSFFDPNWMDLGLLGTYGRLLGVNWVWSVCLTIFHAVYSITIPLLVFELLYPELKGKRLLSDRGLVKCFAFLSFIVMLCYLVLTQYRPDATTYLATMVLVAALFAFAWKVRLNIVAARTERPVLRPRLFLFAGGLFSFAFFIIMYAVPNLVSFPLIPILLEIALSLATLLFIVKYVGSVDNPLHKHAFASGILSFLIFLSFILEIGGIRGMAVAGIFFIVFLIWLMNRIAGQEGAGMMQKREHRFNRGK